MKDKLEQHIGEQKELLDVYEPDGRIWERIDQEIRPRRQKFRRVSSWVAAAAIVTGLAFGGSELYIQMNADTLPGAPPPPSEWIGELGEKEVDPIATELARIESYYFSVIESHKNRLVSYKQEGLELDQTFSTNLSHLQNLYGNLQQELAYGEDKEVVVDAMVQNLMTQIEILSQQLRILENIKQMKDEREMQL